MEWKSDLEFPRDQFAPVSSDSSPYLPEIFKCLSLCCCFYGELNFSLCKLALIWFSFMTVESTVPFSALLKYLLHMLLVLRISIAGIRRFFLLWAC